MSASPLKADMCGAQANVRFVPIADIRLIGPRGHIRRRGSVRFYSFAHDLSSAANAAWMSTLRLSDSRINVLKPVHQRGIFGTQFFL